MTGFASVRGEHEGWTWVSEIRSVNGRGLDLRLRVPDWIEGLEPELRKRLQARLSRGNVTVGIKVQRDDSAGGARVNDAGLEAALAALGAIQKAAKSADLSLRKTSAADIAAMRGVMEIGEVGSSEDITGLRTALLENFMSALEAFEGDRAREGATLASVLGDQIGRIETLSAEAASALGDREAAARAGIERALARLLEVHEAPDEARLLQELALIAVKNDVTEELDRLASHVAAARDLLAASGPVGRKLDFLMQEFNREANTLCSKAQSKELTAIGLDLKAVIDQMREQVANIE
ncbi:MAG: YicC family protein [Silicimonas sp.]|nr:YicC family protein [Silicimonas sp.]